MPFLKALCFSSALGCLVRAEISSNVTDALAQELALAWQYDSTHQRQMPPFQLARRVLGFLRSSKSALHRTPLYCRGGMNELCYIYASADGINLSFLPDLNTITTWVTDYQWTPKQDYLTNYQYATGELYRMTAERFPGNSGPVYPGWPTYKNLPYTDGILHRRDGYVGGRPVMGRICVGDICGKQQGFVSAWHKPATFREVPPTAHLGLGRTSFHSSMPGFLATVFNQKKISTAEFSLCGADGAAAFYLGNTDSNAYKAETAWSQRVISSAPPNTWEIGISGIVVMDAATAEEVTQQVSRELDSSYKYVAALATGASWIHLPGSAFDKFQNSFESRILSAEAEGLRIFVPCDATKTVYFVFGKQTFGLKSWMWLERDVSVEGGPKGRTKLCRTVFITFFRSIGPMGSKWPAVPSGPPVVQKFHLGITFLKEVHSTFRFIGQDSTNPIYMVTFAQPQFRCALPKPKTSRWNGKTSVTTNYENDMDYRSGQQRDRRETSFKNWYYRDKFGDHEPWQLNVPGVR